MWKIISDLAPIISVIISAILSYVVASAKSKNEIQKLKATHNREDILRYHNAYALVMEKSYAFYFGCCGASQKEAINAIATLIAVAPEELHETLKQMDIAVTQKDVRSMPDLRKQLEAEFLNHK